MKPAEVITYLSEHYSVRIVDERLKNLTFARHFPISGYAIAALSL